MTVHCVTQSCRMCRRDGVLHCYACEAATGRSLTVRVSALMKSHGAW